MRWIAHVATVYGEPGSGFIQVQEIGRCVSNVLLAVEGPEYAARSVLFPLLGVGQGRGTILPTATTMATVILSHLTSMPATTLEAVYLLAYTDAELMICREVLDSMPELTPDRA